MIARDPTSRRPYVFALAVALLLIVAILIVSLAWPDMLPWAHKASVVARWPLAIRWRSGKPPLTMRPTGLGSGAYKDDPDFAVYSGAWQIGRI
jgi:hypothetical protein